MAVHVLEQANRCLQCKKPRCREGCPIHTNIPEMIRLLKENKMLDAADMLFANNPLSVVCSLVCNHDKQCEGHCVRGLKGSPVHISAIENYISDACFERLRLEMAPPNGMKAAVIGGGPAGITIAITLALRGYKITIFEGREKIGGILRYGIPEFRLPHSILDRYAKKLREMGILIRPNFTIGGSTSIQDLLDDGYRSVFIGTGAWRPRRLMIPGETFGNVHYAINYLHYPEVYELGDNVAIIGAGNAAMDVARTVIRRGSKTVTVYVRTSEVSASKEEFDYTMLDGVQFVYNKAVMQIVDDGMYICDTEEIREEDGSPAQDVIVKEETRTFVPATSIIIAISQVPQDRLVNRDKELKLNSHGNLATNENGKTTMPGVFASGDVVTGAKTVVDAVAQSKRIADDMDRYMKNMI